MSKLRVLLTNENLTQRGGAALYVRDVAVALLRKGHKPVVYSPELGEVAAELRAATIPVVGRLDDLAEAPDVIHGQHHLAAMMAMLHFSNTPALYVSHSWNDAPVQFPRLLRYVAVDEVCYDHLVSENGISPDRVKLVLNFADMRRFRPRTALPSTPRRALIFSNTVSEARGLEAIREAGAHAGLDVDALGYGTGSASANPERVLPEYDIVFAKARCAIEAMAVGCAVVTCDVDGLADMVTMNNFEELRRLNFGRRSLVNPLDPTLIFEAIRRYSAPDAERVAKQIRSTAGLDNAVDQLISTYEDVVKEHRRSRPDPSGDLRATATYLSKLDLRDEPQGAARLMPTTTPEVLPRLLSDETLLTPIREFSPLDIEVTGGTIADAGHKRSRGGIPNRSLLLNTPPLPWQYAAILPMPADVPPGLAPRACVIRVRLRVHKGSAGVGVLDEDRTDFLARQSVLASDGLIDVFLRVRRFDSATDLVFQTWDRAEVGLIQIDQIELYLAGLAHLNEGLQNAD